MAIEPVEPDDVDPVEPIIEPDLEGEGLAGEELLDVEDDEEDSEEDITDL